MEGIHYVTNDKNEKIAVQIDLNNYGELWEDFYDVLISELRKDEESISWNKAKEVLKKEGNCNVFSVAKNKIHKWSDIDLL